MVLTVFEARLDGGLREEEVSERVRFLGGGVFGKGTDPLGGPTMSMDLNVVLRGRVEEMWG